jgi:hypothetical protein
MVKKHAFGIVLLVAGLVSACSDSTPSEPRPARARLNLTLSSSTVDLGQRIPVTLTLLNDGDEPLHLGFSSSCQVDLVIESAAGAEVWSLMSRTLCLAAITSFTLQPSQSVQYELSWDQTRNDGSRPRPGTYTVRGILLTSSRPQSAPATLTVKSSG